MKKRIIPDVVNQQDITALDKSSSVHDAVQAMSTHHISAMVVADHAGKLIGITTEGDMTHRVLSCGLNPQTTCVADVMTEDPITLFPGDDPHDAIDIMLKRNFRHLPVISEDGQIMAIVSMRDLLRATTKDLDAANDLALKTAFTPNAP